MTKKADTPPPASERHANKTDAEIVADARQELGDLWGFDRALTRAELGRALDLSPKFGGSHISKLEKGLTNLSGPIKVAMFMMLDGALPYTMSGVIKPGYPKGSVR
jgi:hypothetical protein